jgi:penicillin-binding protein 1B
VPDSKIETPEIIEPVASPAPAADFLHRRPVKIFLAAAMGLFLIGLSLAGVYYVRFGRLIDRKLKVGAFSQSVNIYAAPTKLRIGDTIRLEQVVAHLRKSGYSAWPRNMVGHYNLRADAIEIYPGAESYFGPEPAVLQFAGKRISHIIALADNTARTEYQLEPELITNLSDKTREKRRIVRYADIPPALVHAVVAVEDKHFFKHSGLDAPRMLKAAWVDLREGRKEQGASTLSMQLSRNLWLDPDKTFKRKIAEVLIAMHLEHKLTKQQIFEIYCNQVYLGRRGTFSIN